MNPLQYILILPLKFYRWVISPMKQALFGSMGRCRFTPTCSEYAIEAIQKHGGICGTVLGARRLCRCHPWGGFGFDPVPSTGQPNNPEKEKLNSSDSSQPVSLSRVVAR